MKIAVDISQLAYKNTGVANYLENLVLKMVEEESHEFVLFFSSLRRPIPESISKLAQKKNVTVKRVKIPPSVLHLLWNVMHRFPIDKFVGTVDLVVTSDWTEPPSGAKKATVLYDLIIYKHPEETAQKIIDVQKKKLSWVSKESDVIFCISESTKKDAIDILGLPEKKLKVVYPGFI